MTSYVAGLGSLTLGFAPVSLLSATTAAATTGPLLWFVTRAAAISAYITLASTVILGLCRSLARTARLRTPWALDEVHQFLAVITAVFVALHLLALLFDPLIPFTLLNLIAPVEEPYRPLAVDLGVLGLYALTLVLVSSWLRRRIAYVRWRTLHYASFAVFVLITAHGIFAGNAADQTWMYAIYLGASAIVLLLVLVRLLWMAQPSGDLHSPTRTSARSSA
jgi:predicted ferric reductase